MLTKDETKRLAALHALPFAQQGMTIGIGTGTTVYWFIKELAKKVTEGFKCRCVPTSNATKTLALELGLPMLSLNEVKKIDLTIDGADEIDPQLQLIKGGGAALLQEKMVASASDQLIIIADAGKLVTQLGAFPLPVEVIPYGWKQVQRHVEKVYQVRTSLRMAENKTLLTDHGHYILDCQFQKIAQPSQLAIALNSIPGVVDNGLFINMASQAIVAYPDKTIKILPAI